MTLLGYTGPGVDQIAIQLNTNDTGFKETTNFKIWRSLLMFFEKNDGLCIKINSNINFEHAKEKEATVIIFCTCFIIGLKVQLLIKYYIIYVRDYIVY